MTTHLRDTEFVEFAEGTLAPSRAGHLDTCARCRAQAEEVAAALRQVSRVEMPEPSPLFWDHFTARVREQVAHEVPEPAGWWSSVGVRALVPLVAALAVLIAFVSIELLPRVTRSALPAGELASSHVTPAAGPATGDPDLLTPVDDQDAEVWAVLTAAASDMRVDEAHAAGMGAHIGAVDHEVTHLNQAELKELGRLLQSELNRSSD
jgi:hypothetical protein